MLQEELAICRSTQRTPEHVNDQALVMDAQPMLAEDVDEKAEQKLELAKTCAASFNLRLKPVDTSTTPITIKNNPKIACQARVCLKNM